MKSFNRSEILQLAWRLARSAAARDGKPVLSHIGATMRAAWSGAKTDLALARHDAMQPAWHAVGLSMEAYRDRQAVSAQTTALSLVAQQFAAFDPSDLDPSDERPDLVCASPDQARILLAGIEVERAGQDRRAAETTAAAATVHPPGLPDNRWLDEEVMAFVDGVLREAGDADDGQPFLPRVSDQFIAEWGAYHATKAWVDLFEKERDAPTSVPFGALFDARQEMQAAHARLDALTAKAAS